MQQALGTKVRTPGELIADALSDTVSELRLIDAADLVGYVKAGQWANIADLIQSSAELSFEDGALTFACAADVEVNWGRPIWLSFELEFQQGGVTVFFTLILGPDDSRVVVNAIWYATTPIDENDALRALAVALSAARRDNQSPIGRLTS